MLLFICVLFAVCLCGCNSSENEFTPKETGIVVYPDQETADTINGYLKEEPEENITIGQPQYSTNTNDEQGYYVNINSRKFHYPDCRYAKKMDSASLRIEDNYTQLIAEGFVPCKVCKP